MSISTLSEVVAPSQDQVFPPFGFKELVEPLQPFVDFVLD